MPNKTFYSKLLLVAILFTLVALVAKDLLPKKTLLLMPSSTATKNYYLSEATDEQGNKTNYWVDYEQGHFHCVYGAGEVKTLCALTFSLGSDRTHGVNLQQFDGVNIGITYKGTAKNLRITMRNFDPRVSREADYNSDKFNFLNVRIKDLGAPIYISWNEFKVADWWVAMFNLPREQAHVDLRNVISLTLDIEEDLRNSEHDIQLQKIEFVGDWVSTENWYLAILLGWLVFGTGFAVTRLIHLQRIERLQSSKISDLVVTNSRLRTETDKFRKLSTVDSLTNAFNRHGIEQIIESLEIRLNATSIIILDIDHFKRINDRRGHDTGDRVLQKISDIILNSTRSTDKLGRWGGEEFILICPNTSVGLAMALAEKLRLIIFDTVFEPDNPIAVTSSFGVAAISPNEPFANAFKRADNALYEAKSLGRNCVVVAEDDNPHLIV